MLRPVNASKQGRTEGILTTSPERSRHRGAAGPGPCMRHPQPPPPPPGGGRGARTNQNQNLNPPLVTPPPPCHLAPIHYPKLSRPQVQCLSCMQC